MVTNDGKYVNFNILTEKVAYCNNIKIFVKGMIFVGNQKFFRVDFGFSLCYNAPNDKGNVHSTYIGMEFRPIYLQGIPFW